MDINENNSKWVALPSFLQECSFREVLDKDGNIVWALVINEPKSPDSIWVLTRQE